MQLSGLGSHVQARRRRTLWRRRAARSATGMLFSLRRVDAKELVAQAGAGLQKSAKRPKADKVLDDALLADVFGIEMADIPPAKKPVAATSRKPPATTKTTAGKKSVAKKESIQPAAGSRKSITGKAAAAKTKAVNIPATPKGKAATTKRTSVQLVKRKPR